MMIIAIIMNLTVYAPPFEMDWFLYFVPTFTFSRAIYSLCVSCAYDSCVGSFSAIPAEGLRCTITLYVSFVIYLVLALYLY